MDRMKKFCSHFTKTEKLNLRKSHNYDKFYLEKPEHNGPEESFRYTVLPLRRADCESQERDVTFLVVLKMKWFV